MRNLTHIKSEEAERQVLGCVLQDERCLLEIAKVITRPEYFWLEPHRHIWRALLSLQDAGAPLDRTALKLELHSEQGSDGRTLLEAVTQQRIEEIYRCVPSATNASFYARQVAECWQRRFVTQGAERLAQEAEGGGEPAQLAESARKLIEGMALERGESAAVREVTKRTFAYLEERVGRGSDVAPLCGIDPVDRLKPDGWEAGKYYILGAFSQMGKTSVASAICGGLCRGHDVRVSLHQCEIKPELQQLRLASAMYGLRESWALAPERVPRRMADGFWADLTGALGAMSQLPIHIHDTDDFDIRSIELEVQQLRAAHPEQTIAVMVDYLQMVDVPGARDEGQAVREASRRLQKLAKSTDSIVLALSQLTELRKGDSKSPMPKISQGQWTSQIEHDADQALIWHRPFHTVDGLESFAVLELNKNRWGPCAHVLCHADLATKQIRWHEGEPPREVPQLHTKRLYARRPR